MSENMPVNVEIDNGIGSVTFADDVIAIIAGPQIRKAVSRFM